MVGNHPWVLCCWAIDIDKGELKELEGCLCTAESNVQLVCGVVCRAHLGVMCAQASALRKAKALWRSPRVVNLALNRRNILECKAPLSDDCKVEYDPGRVWLILILGLVKF